MSLSEIMTQVRGLTYSKKDVADTPAEGLMPVLRAGNIQHARIIEENYVYVPKELIKEKQFLKLGDVLIAASSGSISIVGKAAMIEKDMNATFGAFCKVLRPDKNKVDNNYFKHFFETAYYKRTIKSLAEGANINNLKTQHFDDLEIPLPPLDQQKKIAAILDAADAYRQKTKALIDKYDELTQSLFLDMFGDPVRNPKGWEKKNLVQLTSKIGSGATPRGGKEAYKKEGVSLIRSMNVYDNKFKYKNLAFIDDAQANKLKNVLVEKEDVLFNITGASICRSTVVPEDVLPARVNQHVSILRPIKSLITSKFLSHFLISENVKRKLLGVGSGGGAVMEAITKEQLQNIKVIVPTLILQEQFAERVQDIEAQKAQAQTSLAQADNLFNSLLQKAFKGGLVS